MEYLTWGALALSAGSLVTLFKFWLDFGRIIGRIEDAAEAARLSSAQGSLLSANLNDFKVVCAHTYATVQTLRETEQQLSKGIEGIYVRLDAVTSRLDSLITLAKPHPG